MHPTNIFSHLTHKKILDEAIDTPKNCATIQLYGMDVDQQRSNPLHRKRRGNCLSRRVPGPQHALG